MLEIVEWLQAAPEGTLVRADAIAERLVAYDKRSPVIEAPRAIAHDGGSTPLLDRFWRLPADTRLGVKQLVEALGKPRSWIYRRTGSQSDLPKLPHKRDGSRLVFVVGEVKQYLNDHEVRIVAPSIELPSRAKAMKNETTRPLRID